MEQNILQSPSTIKITSNMNVDLYDLVVKKNTDFIENIQSKKVSERFFFKHQDFSVLDAKIKLSDEQLSSPCNFNSILFDKEYRKVSIIKY